MIDWYTLVIAIAVLVVMVLFRFVGCSFTHGGSVDFDYPYPDAVKKDSPLIYYRLQETGSPTTATDEMGNKDGTYGVAPSPLEADPAYLSQPIGVTSVELGGPSIMQQVPGAKSVMFNGGFVSAFGLIGDLPRFSLEAIVRPEWGVITQLGFFYCVMENSMYLAGYGAPPPDKNAGFALYAGPDDPSNPATSPYTWQLWVGTGNEFARANPLNGAPGPPVRGEPTYLAVTFDDTQAFLYVYTADADIDSVRSELIRRPYLQATQVLRIGIAGDFPGLVPPPPGPQGFIYPFVGRMAEVAIYDTILDSGRIISHIMAAFNT